MLGEEQVFAPRIVEALLVHPDPLAWMRNGRRGVVVVDRPQAVALLRNAGTLIAADLDQGRQLREALETPPPRILISPQVEGASA
jgi:archaeosine-15-forming tRNA-guanine transglycosylase